VEPETDAVGEEIMSVCDLVIRLPGALGPPGMRDTVMRLEGGFLVSRLGAPIDGGGALLAMARLPLLRLAFLPSVAKKPVLPEVPDEEEETEEEVMLLLAVSLCRGCGSGLDVANAGYGSAKGGLEELGSSDAGLKSVALVASGRRGKEVSVMADESEVTRGWGENTAMDGTEGTDEDDPAGSAVPLISQSIKEL
jgi:hypothetical protein